jgi:hypothetical protein
MAVMVKTAVEEVAKTEVTGGTMVRGLDPTSSPELVLTSSSIEQAITATEMAVLQLPPRQLPALLPGTGTMGMARAPRPHRPRPLLLPPVVRTIVAMVRTMTIVRTITILDVMDCPLTSLCIY